MAKSNGIFPNNGVADWNHRSQPKGEIYWDGLRLLECQVRTPSFTWTCKRRRLSKRPHFLFSLADGQGKVEMNMRRSFIIVDLLESGKAKVQAKWLNFRICRLLKALRESIDAEILVENWRELWATTAERLWNNLLVSLSIETDCTPFHRWRFLF